MSDSGSFGDGYGGRDGGERGVDSDGFRESLSMEPNSHGLQPSSDGLQPSSDGFRMV